MIEIPTVTTWPLTQAAKTIYSSILMKEKKPLDVDHLLSNILEQNKFRFGSKQNNFNKIYYGKWDPIKKNYIGNRSIFYKIIKIKLIHQRNHNDIFYRTKI